MIKPNVYHADKKILYATNLPYPFDENLNKLTLTTCNNLKHLINENSICSGLNALWKYLEAVKSRVKRPKDYLHNSNHSTKGMSSVIKHAQRLLGLSKVIITFFMMAQFRFTSAWVGIRCLLSRLNEGDHTI